MALAFSRHGDGDAFSILDMMDFLASTPIIEEVCDFFCSEGAAGGLIGSFLVLSASYFSVLEVGARKSTPIHKESFKTKLLFVVCGAVVGAVVFQGFSEFNIIVYVSVGAAWLHILKNFITVGIIVGKAIEKKASLIDAGGGE